MEAFTVKKEGLQTGWIARLKEKEYLSLKTARGERIHGGVQNWYYERSNAEELKKQGINKRYQLCKRDENFRLASLGCGVIAMINAQIYLKRRKLREQEPETQAEELTQKSYQAFVDESWKRTYHIGRSYVNYVAGLYPWKMEKGLQRFIKDNGFQRQRVRWAPYVFALPGRQKELVLQTVIDMLRADYPVVFAYHTFQPRTQALVLYDRLEDAMMGLPKGKRDDEAASHYMTIIGVYRAPNEQVILQVESWGRIFYLRYDAYAQKLSYFSNILSVI